MLLGLEDYHAQQGQGIALWGVLVSFKNRALGYGCAD